MAKGHRLYVGDALEIPRTFREKLFDTCVTSPPYYGLRDYKTAKWEGGDDECVHKATGPVSERNSLCVCGARRVDKQYGLERTPQEYIEKLVAVFAGVRRVLKDDGTLWLNLGDSYFGGDGRNRNAIGSVVGAGRTKPGGGGMTMVGTKPLKLEGLKPKDLMGMPWRVALALQADGWYLRQDIIWCLSGGTTLYARTQKGDRPATIKDLSRLDPATVKLWNGEKWTQVLGWSKTGRNADEIELVLRSGERIACTPNHQFPTDRGLLRADEIQVGDRMTRVVLPEPDAPKAPAHVTNDAAWFAGLYLAEGSMAGDTIQIAGNAAEVGRLARVRRVAEAYGGVVTCTIDGNNQSIRVYGKLLVAILEELVAGSLAKDKSIAAVCWTYSNAFLRSMLEGYLEGDGHWDAANGRWRLGFTRNYNLEGDLRVLAARLDFRLTLKPVFVDGWGEEWPAFRGEIRFETSGHGNEKQTDEVVEIRKARCRNVYDVGVEDEPHLFALASGILSHNSKPNPMPESVTDRCTKAHEYLFLFSKSAKYYFDHKAIREPCVTGWTNSEFHTGKTGEHQQGRASTKPRAFFACRMAPIGGVKHTNDDGDRRASGNRPEWDGMRNKRSVWTIPPARYKEAHFATFPPKLVEPCILAGSREGGRVLDPFAGSGTTLAEAVRLGRRGVGVELNPTYAALAETRIAKSYPSKQGNGLLPKATRKAKR